MIQVYLIEDDPREVEACIFELQNGTVWSPSEKKFVANPPDAFFPLRRMAAEKLNDMRFAVVDVPPQTVKLFAAFKYVNQRGLLGEPVPVEAIKERSLVTWGAWVW